MIKPLGHFLCLAVLAVFMGAGFPASAAGTNGLTNNIYFSNVPASKVLDIYKQVVGLKLEMDAKAKAMSDSPINMKTSGPTGETTKLIEKALREQAGLIITRLDDKTARVTYDPAVRIAQPPPVAPANEK